MRALLESAVLGGLLGWLAPAALAGPTLPIDGAGYNGGQAHFDQAASASWSDGGEFSRLSDVNPVLMLSTNMHSSLAKDPTGSRTFWAEIDEYICPQQCAQL